MSGAGEADIVAIDAFRDGLLAMEGGIESVADAAEASPGCCLLQVYAAVLFLHAGTEQGTKTALSWLARAERASSDSSVRERMLLEGCRSWSRGDNESAIELFEGLTKDYPRDLVAAKACEHNYYLTGQHHQGPRYLAHMGRIAPYNQDQADVLAMYAFAFDLVGEYERARAEAERAVELRFGCAWAQHALAHVSMMTGENERGQAEQEHFLKTWTNPGPSIHGHNAWHLALFRLEQNDTEGVMELFRDLVWGHLPESTGEQVDAVSLLWRLELAGYPIEDRLWAEVADACVPLAGEAVAPFVVVHHACALARAAREESVEHLRGAVARSAREQPAARRAVWQQAGIPVMEAAIAWARRDSQRVIEVLEPAAREIPLVGGSDAQDDLFRMTLIDALVREGQKDSARSLVELFPGNRSAVALL